MATLARTGAGTKLQLQDGASYLTVVELLTLKQGGKKVDLIDVTNMDSAAQNGLIYREFITGLADGGELDFTANYIPGDAAQETFHAAFDGTRKTWRITLPNDPTTLVSMGHWDFQGYITTDEKDYPLDKQMLITGKIKITGPDTFTAGA